MYFRFGKVFHFFSVLLFVFFFLYIYSALSDQVVYSIDDQGNVLKLIPKETFFYSGLILFIILNVIVILPAKLIENQSTKTIKRLFPIGDISRDYMLTWAYSFAGIINISLAILAFFVHSINNQNEIGTGEFAIFFYLIPVFFVVWMVGLFWILGQKFKSIQAK